MTIQNIGFILHSKTDDREARPSCGARWYLSVAALSVIGVATLGLHSSVSGADLPVATQFRNDILPILKQHCFECHADGENKAQVAFDKLESDAEISQPTLWYRVLKNVRAGLMPPPDQPRLSKDELQKIENWIKFSAFALDSKNPDPGRVTVRRLNRNEYRNSIRDLIGIDFDVDVALPPDDIGYGFDNIGDVLSISPMRMEKFIEAAIAVADKGVPMDSVVIPTQMALPYDFLSADGSQTGDRMSFYESRTVSKRYHAKAAGDYRIHIAGKVDGGARLDPQRVRVRISSDDKEFFSQEYKWSDAEYYDDERIVHWEPGDHTVSFSTEPLLDLKPLGGRLDYRILYVRLDGPLDRSHWEHPPGYERFYSREAPPDGAAERREYAKEVLSRFVPKAFRRPVSSQQLDQLVALAERNYSLPNVPFEKGVAQAIIAVLASPRFLFHLESSEPLEQGQAYARIDEFTLASRLSFALWCSVPDAELMQLAARGELRAQFDGQVRRMLADPKSQAFVENFSGQWLQSRGVLDVPINSTAVMAAERVPVQAGQSEAQLNSPIPIQATLSTLDAAPQRVGELASQAAPIASQATPAVTSQEVAETAPQPAPEAGVRGNTRAGRGARGNAVGQAGRRGRGAGSPPSGLILTPEVRQAMKQEVEAYFGHIVRDDRSVLELLQSDYTFVNESLAPVYNIAGITGSEMRLVKLAPNDFRGGVLTMGSVLTVTSNPTRTSPVKRGKWILENILGAPSAPPPPNIPALEDTAAEITDHPPSQRELLARHRQDALCASCHNRMDPLGLAMESFNAFGRTRSIDNGRTIDAAGELVTGEKFSDVRDLKRALVEKHRIEFYRTLTEKLMTYVLGRGVEYYDVATIDSIVERMDQQEGRFSALLMGVLESAPFQQRRPVAHAIPPSAISSLTPEAMPK